ncbi:MAG: hypothetical protein E6767_15805 [Dysgonomonas sp.]|nr:hypothetical protein [Dysgonomonas sp.]
MKTIKKMLFSFMILLMTACSTVSVMTSSKMNKLELGMSKEQVTSILGKEYTIAEKRIENGVKVEVLSYRNYPQNEEEFYLFLFKDNKLEKWYRELLPNNPVYKQQP